ncbi:MAG: glycoside hydrolase family 3 C-terminal domain-containing protein [Chloroflexota bacterium]
MKTIKDLISEMTIEEKASLCSGLDFWHIKGVKRLGIPSIMVADGPHGLRKQVGDSSDIGKMESYPATCFPTASALAASWDRELVFQVGEALAEECKQEKIGVLLGPGANIKRSPLCGRNFEYFSEDPYLSGEIAKSHINGVQSLGIGTSLKHYAVNNQEYRRMTIDAIVDERALREIYLAGFEIAVKEAQPWTLMGAYNKLNGTYVCEHPDLMRTILKEEWGHQGLVITDWGAMNQRVDALKAGLDLEMPGPHDGNDASIVQAVRSGELDPAVLDKAVERLLTLIFKAKATLAEDYTYDQHSHHALARRASAEGAVLLKNDSETLPLAKNVKVAVVGEMAKTPRYQGAGSSLINPSQLDNIFDEIVKIAGPEQVSFIQGYPARGLHLDESLIGEAVRAVKGAEVVVICAGLPDSFEVEGLDREHMRLPDSHNALIKAVAGAHPSVVVVLSNGSPVEMPWVDDVQAILEGHLGGQAGAGGIADILYGLVNPSGKLAESFPIKLEDNPSNENFPGGPAMVEYRESIFVGYRFYDTVEKEVLFPFGHGLSYTQFEYQDIKLSKSNIGDEDTLEVGLLVKNIGEVPGKEVVQLYVSPVESAVFRPKAELKGFEKVNLQPGETRQLTFTLNRRAFAYYNTAINDWHVESGAYRILIGSSSRDIRLEDQVKIASTQKNAAFASRDQLPAYLNFPDDAKISQDDFEQLLGRQIPFKPPEKRGDYTLNTPIGDMTDTLFGRLLNAIVQRQLKKTFKGDLENPTGLMMQSMVKGLPLRGLIMAGGGNLSLEMLNGLLVIFNGRLLKGIFSTWKAISQNKRLG